MHVYRIRWVCFTCNRCGTFLVRAETPIDRIVDLIFKKHNEEKSFCSGCGRLHSVDGDIIDEKLLDKGIIIVED